MNQDEIAILLLAAGGAFRMGRVKQLLSWRGHSLLVHSVHQALALNAGPVTVVTGAYRESVIPELRPELRHELGPELRPELRPELKSDLRPELKPNLTPELELELNGPELKSFPVELAENPSWYNGIGSSIRVGMNSILSKTPQAQAVLILLCDQPLVTTESLHKILKARTGPWETSLIAAEYRGSLGVPALFGSSYFQDLRMLPDEAGAKQILLRNQSRLIKVALPEASFDLDTPADLLTLETMAPL